MTSLDEIGHALEGYDPQALSAQAVGEFLHRLVEPLTDTEEVTLRSALDRVLAHELISPLSVPPHDNSAMDGYAFQGAQLVPGQALELEVRGTALAGRAWQGEVEPGQCVKIMTGAVMPTGLDTVVPQEFSQDVGLRRIRVPTGVVQPGDNRRCCGEDLMAGDVALAAGTRLGPAALGLIASLGLTRVCVRRRPKVAYFSTGDEILQPGELPREGAVYDSNRHTVHAMLTRLGCEVLDLGLVRDEPALMEQAFRTAATQADAIITSGGVSVGEADFTKTMMKQLGDVVFWRIAMRPGRPMAVGRIQHSGQSALLFGLPGNPVAVMVTFLAFVRPALLRLMGAQPQHPVLLQAHSQEELRKKPGRTEYQRAMVSTASDGRLQVRITGSQGSGVLSSMVQANGLIVLHHGQGQVMPGDVVDVMMFDGAL